MSFRRNTSLTAIVLEEDEEIRSLLWREWLDTFYLAEKKEGLLLEEPPVTGTVWDAILAAGVAWLARKSGLPVPNWTKDSQRVAKKPWWDESDPKSANARISQVLAPPEFFERNLFVSPSFMYRARMPVDWIEKEPKYFSLLAEKILNRK